MGPVTAVPKSAIDNRQPAILLLGPTGSGKTPLGELLEERGFRGRRCFHFDFGANLRRVGEGAGPTAAMSETDVAVVSDALRTGALLENGNFHIAETILAWFVAEHGVGEHDLLVMNGLPRHVDQATDVDRLVEICRVLVLECDADTARERIRLNTGGDRSGRQDDSLEEIARKMDIFSERTIPLLDHYRGKGVEVLLLPVGIDSTPDTVYAEIESYGPTD